MPQVPQTFDALAVRTWCGLALEALGRAREEIDAINVYPVADGDTGTNLYLTLESATAAVEAVFAGHEVGGREAGGGDEAGGCRPTLADAVRAMAHGALIGARGNSGTILAQLLRGMAQVLAADSETAHTDGPGLRLALRQAADSARQAVAHPVEGTVLTVASAAADAANGAEGDCGTVARAAYEGARAALAATTGQLAVLERAGVVDAGGRGLVAVLAALVETFTGEAPRMRLGSPEVHARVAAVVTDVDIVGAGIGGVHPDVCEDGAPEEGGPAFEVIYLLEAEDAAVDRLRGPAGPPGQLARRRRRGRAVERPCARGRRGCRRGGGRRGRAAVPDQDHALRARGRPHRGTGAAAPGAGAAGRCGGRARRGAGRAVRGGRGDHRARTARGAARERRARRGRTACARARGGAPAQ